MKYTDCSTCKYCLGITAEKYLICPKIDWMAKDGHYPLKYCKFFEKKKKEERRRK